LSKVTVSPPPSIRGFRPTSLGVEIENESECVYLLVGTFAGIVLVLVVRIELEVFAYGEQTARIECGAAPFGIFALIECFGADVRGRMLGTNRESPFEGQAVAITPHEFAVGPIQISAIPVGN